jgi:hypothetical protein
MVASSSTSRDDLGLAEIERLSHAGRNGLELLRGVADAVRPLVAFNALWATTTDPATSSVVGGRRGRDPIPPAVLDTHSARVSFKHESCGIVASTGRGASGVVSGKPAMPTARGGTPTRASA